MSAIDAPPAWLYVGGCSQDEQKATTVGFLARAARMVSENRDHLSPILSTTAPSIARMTGEKSLSGSGSETHPPPSPTPADQRQGRTRHSKPSCREGPM